MNYCWAAKIAGNSVRCDESCKAFEDDKCLLLEARIKYEPYIKH